ncbi:MAG: bifunctional homocysteine S-methyltransferase/methylenetetrahydrofolate reductase [Lachnospiraceae bacterium]|nr:bifunctional homocysteine S-methyltransferase/methylenetetrahydrofolate reductase [Lachnospiraceae bacterium]
MAVQIKEYVKTHRIITDGAMGTYYAKLARAGNSVCEYANIRNPEQIRRIHLDYLRAGADLLRTNTFAACREILGVSKEEQRELIKKACEIAEEAVKEYYTEGTEPEEAAEQSGLRPLSRRPIFIAGDIGPIPEHVGTEEAELVTEYREMADCMLDAGLTVIWFETFAEFGMIKRTAAYIKEKNPDVWIMAEFCVDKYGYTRQGLRADRLLKEAKESGVIDACGLNCGIGSGHMDTVLGRIRLPEGITLSAAPNAGYPEQMQSRMSFVNNVKYFCSNLEQIAGFGISILGGCCGTTPSYIEELSRRIEKNSPAVRTREALAAGEGKKKEEKQGRFAKLLEEKHKKGEKIIAVELDPPYDANDDKVLESALALKSSGADIITIADSPMGRSRIDPILMGVKLAGISGLPVMPHIACRDRNVIAVRSQFLGAYVNGIRNFLIVTGDPVPSENRRSITSVFDYNSIRLMQFLKEMNEEHFAEDPIVYGGALNYGQGRIDKIIERMERKIEAGASYFLTQPVFSEEDIERLAEIRSKVDTRILCGIMPLVSWRNANFIKNEIAGVHVPDEIVARYRPDMDKEEAEWTGAKIAEEVIGKLNGFADGYYFMLPFNRVSLMEKIRI